MLRRDDEPLLGRGAVAFTAGGVPVALPEGAGGAVVLEVVGGVAVAFRLLVGDESVLFDVPSGVAVVMLAGVALVEGAEAPDVAGVVSPLERGDLWIGQGTWRYWMPNTPHFGSANCIPHKQSYVPMGVQRYEDILSA